MSKPDDAFVAHLEAEIVYLRSLVDRLNDQLAAAATQHMPGTGIGFGQWTHPTPGVCSGPLGTATTPMSLVPSDG